MKNKNIVGKKLSLKELMEKNEFKKFKLLRLHIHDDWNSQKYMNNDYFKWLLDWENKIYIGNETGNTNFYYGYYTNQYDDYIVWNAEPFDDVCLNLMITPNRREWVDKNKFINRPNISFKLPIIDKDTNLLFGNGITLEILKETKYQKDYLSKNIIFRSFNLRPFEISFFSKKFEIDLHLHHKANSKCKKNEQLPFINELNKRTTYSKIEFSIDCFYAYKYKLIRDIKNDTYIDLFLPLLTKLPTNNINCLDLKQEFFISSENYNLEYVNKFIDYSKKKLERIIWTLCKNDNNKYEILNNILEDELNINNRKIIELRLSNYKDDFESWFSYSNFLKDCLGWIMTNIIQSNEVQIEDRNELLLNCVTDYFDILSDEEYLKYFLALSLLNYKEEDDFFLTIDYNPPKNDFVKNITNNANKVMTLNYDNFLEKVSGRNDIYHLHGRLDQLILKKDKIIKINKNNLHKYFLRLTELVLIGVSPRTKKIDYLFYDYNQKFKTIKYDKNFKSEKEFKEFIYLQEMFSTSKERKKDDINWIYMDIDEESLSIDLLKNNLYRNKKIVIIGINPLGDLSYLVDLIINYDEIYIGYYSSDDKNNLLNMIENIFDYISNPIHSFYFPKMGIVLNRLDKCKFYYFDTNELYKSNKIPIFS